MSAPTPLSRPRDAADRLRSSSMRLLVVIVSSLFGCTLMQDFDRYTNHRGTDAALPAEETGGCGACAGASRCVDGRCECAPGATKCDGVCTYLDTDPLNCKACGVTVADSSQTCSAGEPVCAGALRPCTPWSFDWGGATYEVTCPASSVCVDTGHDGNHCYKYSGASVTNRVRCYSSTQIGVCVDNVCTYHAPSAASACTGAGRIECAVNTEPSDPDVRSCVDTLRDPNHCGGCNAKCMGKDQLCADGVCKRYRPARVAEDCNAGWRFCSVGFASPVCVEGTLCPS